MKKFITIFNVLLCIGWIYTVVEAHKVYVKTLEIRQRIK